MIYFIVCYQESHSIARQVQKLEYKRKQTQSQCWIFWTFLFWKQKPGVEETAMRKEFDGEPRKLNVWLLVLYVFLTRCKHLQEVSRAFNGV